MFDVALNMTQRKMKDAYERDSIMPGANPAVTDEELIEYLESGVRPVYTAPNVAERFDITRQTAHRRLKELSEESPHIAVTNIGQADAYYVPGVEVIPPGDTEEERLKQSIKQWANDRFVGLLHRPWTAVQHQGPATGGDKMQLQVEGQPGGWVITDKRTWDYRREQLEHGESASGTTKALVSGELYEKATIPVRHLNYPDDADLEDRMGTRFETLSSSDGQDHTILIADGRSAYQLQACDDAVFFTNASVDWISPSGEEQEPPNMDIDWDEADPIHKSTENSPPGQTHKTWDSIEDAPDNVPVDRRAIEEDDDDE